MDDFSELAQLRARLDILEQRLEKLDAPLWPKYEEVNPAFEELVRCVDFRNLQMLIRVTDVEHWAKASVTLPMNSVTRIRNNISEHIWKDFIDYAQEVEHLRTITSYREKILSTMRQLEDTGEIVVGWETRPSYWKSGEPLAFSPESPSGEMMARSKVDSAVKEWLETVLPEVGKLPRVRPTDDGQFQV